MALLDSSTTKAVVALALWYATNIFTVILNKYLFQNIGFVFPLTLTAIHMFLSTLGSLIVLKVFHVVPFIAVGRDKLISHVLPLAVVFCVNIILGNVSLRFIPVSFMQTVKSSVPAFTVALQALVLGQESSRATYISLIPVVGGVALASFTEVNFEITGFVAALVASLTTGIQSVVSGILLGGNLKLDSMNLLYYMAPVSLILIFPIAYVMEYDGLMNYDFDQYGGLNFVAFNLIISGVVAYLLNLCVFFAIKSTNPLTFTVFGNLKVVVVIIISVAIFRNEINAWNGFGCFIAIAGIIWYNSIEYQQKEAKKKAAHKLREERSDEPLIPISQQSNVSNPHSHRQSHETVESERELPIKIVDSE